MGIFKTPSYTKSPEELAMEKERAEKIKQAEDEKKALEAAQVKRKKRFAEGKIGTRSLFARAGGRGFYTEGEKT
jgi:hypothetical protein